VELFVVDKKAEILLLWEQIKIKLKTKSKPKPKPKPTSQPNNQMENITNVKLNVENFFCQWEKKQQIKFNLKPKWEGKKKRGL